MAHAIFPTGQFHESAEVHDTDDFTFEDFADFDIAGQVMDDLQSFLHAFGIVGSHQHQAGVFNVDLHARVSNNLVDNFSAGTDDIADFFRIDLHSFDSWR